MHSRKYKIQTSHEHVHKPKHFHWQPIHDNMKNIVLIFQLVKLNHYCVKVITHFIKKIELQNF
jgi:hypothetical protein